MDKPRSDGRRYRYNDLIHDRSDDDGYVSKCLYSYVFCSEEFFFVSKKANAKTHKKLFNISVVMEETKLSLSAFIHAFRYRVRG